MVGYEIVEVIVLPFLSTLPLSITNYFRIDYFLGYKILEVIEGRADAYVHNTAIKKWDLCAGHALLRAMGGDLTTLSPVNNTISYGDPTKFKNEQGLLATMNHHEYYLKKLQSLKKP